MNILEIKEVCSPLQGLKYLTYKKEVPKAETYRNVRRIEKSEEKSQKKGSQKVFEFWDTSPIYRGRNAEKISQKRMGKILKKGRFG